MFYNYFKVALRHLLKHKGFSFINIAGLTLGLTACLLIGLFVRDEKQFDKFIPEGDRIYRLYYKITNNEGTSNIATTPPMFATALKQNFPEVEQTLRLLNIPSKVLFQTGSKELYEEGGVFAEPTFFDFFPLSFTYGSAVKALAAPNAIVISHSMAQKYFGSENPVGKEIRLDKDLFRVTGVFQNNPKFHLPAMYILPLAASGLPDEQLKSWGWYSFQNYVKLKKGANSSILERKFQDYTRSFLTDKQATYLPLLQPLHQIHLYSAAFKYDIAARGNITYVRALSLIAVFILLIACFNFINLATAKSLQRAKEVGVRKAIGASRSQLFAQFIGETLLLTFVSVAISIAVTYLALPWLNNFTTKQIQFTPLSNPFIILLSVGLTLALGLLAGFYPALVLSGFQPLKVLKGTALADVGPGKISWLRHGLVVVQFTLSVLLIISALVVITQVNYLHQKDLGFNKEEIMFFPMQGDNLTKNYETFKNELLQVPGVTAASVGYGFPGDMFGDGIITMPLRGEQKSVKATQVMVDFDYIKTLGLQLLAGRDFSREYKTDTAAAYIINETAAKELGFSTPEQALGHTLLWPTWRKPDLIKKGQIIGVVKDFHYKSLYDKVEPAVLHIYPQAYWKVAVKLKSADIGATVNQVKKVWNRFTPDYPLEYTFLDQSFAIMYKAEESLKTLLWIFTFITIFVSCLGLFGLAAYAAERRRKEIGVRKVLGASINQITLLLSKDFVRLVLVAILLASPVAWYCMHIWLQNFAYRIDIGWWVFAVAGFGSIAIAVITIGFQAIKAAVANPVDALRNE
ncbi:macrolide ABC transporter permease [Adhaeribacter arboris]|uniref:Macrolide ABC transporter permease n=1 Tax=Adhaeribacter arboris TaxID=2072846 RepID=A0A2T2YHU7_9BACT|nr:ABC transporter permease [Adhaeribacter arboris]PSR55081.1 macrolide ABC transporter permease [Adhaeribacter arboris]